MKTWLLIFINPLWIINLNKMSTLWRYIFKAKNKLMSDIVTQRLIIYWTQSFLNTRLPIDMIGISILGWYWDFTIEITKKQGVEISSPQSIKYPLQI